MLIREIRPEDAGSFAGLLEQVSSESEYMLLESGERKNNVEEQKKRIEIIRRSENSTIFMAEEDKQLIGYLIALGGNARRNKHSVYVVIGILAKYRGQGIGTQLFERLENWSYEHGIHRLELTVVNHNEAAIQLYRKMGFGIEGTKKDSLYINGKYVDEYYMSKLL